MNQTRQDYYEVVQALENDPEVLKGVILGILKFAMPGPELREELLSTLAYLTATQSLKQNTTFQTVTKLLGITQQEGEAVTRNLKELLKQDKENGPAN